MPQKCDSLFKYGHESLEEDSGPNGGLAEKCLLRSGTAIVSVPNGVSNQVMCPANCATATVAAAMRTAGSVEGKRVLIFGAGMLGLTTSAMAVTCGASDVCVCDVDAGRLQFAERFGATTATNVPPGEDFDAVFEMSGSVQAVELAINSATIGANVVLVGSVSPSPPVPIDPERVVRRLLSIHGVHNYRPEDLVEAVRFLTDNCDRFPFAELVDREFSLSDSNAAFEYALRHRPIRIAVVP